MPQETKKVRFNEVALEYNGRQYVSVRQVPLLPGDDDDDEDSMYEEFLMNVEDPQDRLRKVYDPKNLIYLG